MRVGAGMGRKFVAALACLAVASAACTSGGREQRTSPRPSPAGTTPAPSPTASPESSPLAGPRLATGEALPAACAPADPGPGATVAFVANGAAWALEPDGGTPTCLFDVADAGPFLWGPLGDRALLAGLEVRGLGGAPSRPAEDLQTGPASWGRPTGKSVVFVAPDGRHLRKVHLDRTALEDVTPLPRARYLSVAYHPSGLAFGFAVQQAGIQSIWMSSNVGEDPREIVFTEEGTEFGALAFSLDGRHLLYAAQHADGHAELHSIDLTDTRTAPMLWASPEGVRILDLWPGPDLAAGFTVGTSCADAAAWAWTAEGPEGSALLPEEGRPTRVLGWVDGGRLLVATGDCAGPFDLSVVDVGTGAATPLVLGVDAGSVRTPAPTPPPPLPEQVGSGSGFA